MSAASVLKARQEDLGTEVFVSGWTQVTQDQVDQFAAVTGDTQWIHVDRKRAAAESEFGTTVVPGLLLLALLPAFRYQIVWTAEPLAMTVHYGFDRVRFIRPVLTGASLRDRIVLAAMEERPGDRLFVKLTHTLEVRGADRPACVAEELVLLCF
jgi:acyl dehydratase